MPVALFIGFGYGDSNKYGLPEGGVAEKLAFGVGTIPVEFSFVVHRKITVILQPQCLKEANKLPYALLFS